MATIYYDLEHMGLGEGWEVDGFNIEYGLYPINVFKGDTVVFNFLGSAYTFSRQWSVKGIDRDNYSNINSAVVDGPPNSETGTATFTVNAGNIPTNASEDILSVRYEDSGGDAINDGEENLAIRFYFFDPTGEIPDVDVTTQYLAVPNIDTGEDPDLLDNETTNFSIQIYASAQNYEKTRNTIYQLIFIFFMNDFLKYLSTAPVLMTAWLSITSTFILAMNFIYPDALTFPVI